MHCNYIFYKLEIYMLKISLRLQISCTLFEFSLSLKWLPLVQSGHCLLVWPEVSEEF